MPGTSHLFAASEGGETWINSSIEVMESRRMSRGGAHAEQNLFTTVFVHTHELSKS